MFDAKAYYIRLQKYVADIRKVTDFVPEIAIVLGSGLGNFADNIDVVAEISYRDLEGFPFSTAPGHDGRFIFGYLKGKKVVCMKGRVHYYEGYEMEEVVLPHRVMHLLGADTIILTNAAGCLNKDFSIGSFVAHNDCITSFVPSVLRGPNIEELGERFVDVTDIYDRKLIDTAKAIGEELGFEVNEGIMLQAIGPHFETAAEIRIYKSMGADVVGMSTVVEAIACRHMGMRIAAISCATNYATGISETKLSGEEVIEIANRVSANFEQLISGLVEHA